MDKEKGRLITRSVNCLPKILSVNHFPSSTDEQNGSGECTTALKYFRDEISKVDSEIEIVPQLVLRNAWEPQDKKSGIHTIAACSFHDHVVIADPTHFMGPGFGQVYGSNDSPWNTVDLTNLDLWLIGKMKTVKNLLFTNANGAEAEFIKTTSLSFPKYLSSWLADLGIIYLNYCHRNGKRVDNIEWLRRIADQNPYKAGILKTCERLKPQISDFERLDGVMTLVNSNIKRLKLTAQSSSAIYLSEAARLFGQHNIKQGLKKLRLGWWVLNMSSPQNIPSVEIDEGSIRLDHLRPLEFVRNGLVSFWQSQNEEAPGYKILLRQEIDLGKISPYGYKPENLIGILPHGFIRQFFVVLAKPNKDIDPNTIKENESLKPNKGDLAQLYSTSLLYPYLTNTDRFSI